MALLVLTVAPRAFAEDDGALHDQFYVALGTFAFSADTELRLDGSLGQSGTDVDWERDLGLKDKNSFRIDSFWRFAEHHKLRLMYFGNKRTSSKALARDLVIDGETYPVDAVVAASTDVRILELVYEYAFMRRESYELSATAGVHMTGMEPGLEITGSINNTPVDIGQAADAKLDAPLPVLGVRGLWQLSENFDLDAHAQYFFMSYDDFDGSIVDYRIALTWTPNAWAGIGIGYNSFSTRIDVGKDRFNGKLDWTYKGPQIFVSASF